MQSAFDAELDVQGARVLFVDGRPVDPRTVDNLPGAMDDALRR